jgi:hypothetical protein
MSLYTLAPPFGGRRYLGEETEATWAKTALGLRDWVPEPCVGECALPKAIVTLGLPRLTPKEAHLRGARSLVIGLANRGGILSASWISLLSEALEAGLDLVSGMHGRTPCKAQSDHHGARSPPHRRNSR